MNEPLPLHIAARPCISCGYCCRQSACAFGEWDAKTNSCSFLTAKNRCQIYRQILSKPQQMWEWNPAFGAGCSSPMNQTRRDKAKQDKRPIIMA